MLPSSLVLYVNIRFRNRSQCCVVDVVEILAIAVTLAHLFECI